MAAGKYQAQTCSSGSPMHKPTSRFWQLSVNRIPESLSLPSRNPIFDLLANRALPASQRSGSIEDGAHTLTLEQNIATMGVTSFTVDIPETTTFLLQASSLESSPKPAGASL